MKLRNLKDLITDVNNVIGLGLENGTDLSTREWQLWKKLKEMQSKLLVNSLVHAY
jgi:hypothetical protein